MRRWRVVPASVEAVSAGFAAGGWDGAGAAELSEGGFAGEALSVVAQCQQEFCGVVRADPEGRGELGGELINEGAQQFFVSADFVVEDQPALGNGAQGVFDRVADRSQLAGAQGQRSGVSAPCSGVARGLGAARRRSDQHRFK